VFGIVEFKFFLLVLLFVIFVHAYMRNQDSRIVAVATAPSAEKIDSHILPLFSCSVDIPSPSILSRRLLIRSLCGPSAEEIAMQCHGYTRADVLALCSMALQQHRKGTQNEQNFDREITLSEMEACLKKYRPPSLQQLSGGGETVMLQSNPKPQHIS
jgi:SpoVK/Ycf46/Vps4 family AAA+-type ATPase